MNELRMPHRRHFLAMAALLALPGLASGDDDGREVEAVEEIARKAGVEGFRSSKNAQFLAVGDAPDAFRAEAMEVLDGLQKDYLKHFADKKFAVTKPSGRMTVVILSDAVKFAAFLGQEPGGAVGGVYEPATNRLIMFDSRGADGGNPAASRVNSFVLFHEATHQLTFNTGLLDRQADVPLAISEGLACYAETRRPNGKGKIGDVNVERLKVLRPANARKARTTLVPLADFLTKEGRFEDPAQEQAAYAQSWLLVHYLMKDPGRAAKFRGYLDAIRSRRDPGRRLEDWRAAFGDPAVMDRELAAYLRNLKSSP